MDILPPSKRARFVVSGGNEAHEYSSGKAKVHSDSLASHTNRSPVWLVSGEISTHSHHTYRPLEPWLAHRMELAYQLHGKVAGPWSYDLMISQDKRLPVHLRHLHFTVCFNDMTQTNIHTFSTCKLRRMEVTNVFDSYVPRCIPEPAHWVTTSQLEHTYVVGDELYEASSLVELQPISLEYRQIVSHFMRTSHPRQMVVKRVFQVQDYNKYEKYELHKQCMQTVIDPSGFFNVDTTNVYHGTKWKHFKSILERGLDPKCCLVSDKTGDAFGRGTYFSTTSSYASEFTDMTVNEERVMLVADILTGNVEVGQKTQERGSLLPGTKHRRYDSTTDHLYKPNLFNVWKSEQVYVKAVIKFQIVT